MSLAPRIPRPKIRTSIVKSEIKASRTNPKHLEMIRDLPCCATGLRIGVEAHHLVEGVDLGRGMGRKAEDRWAIPLTAMVHFLAHQTGTPETWLMSTYGIDARALAEALWRVSPDAEKAERIVTKALMGGLLKMQGSA